MTVDTLIRWAGDTVEKTRHKLPRELRAEADRIPVVYENRPTPEMIDDEITADILGLFVGNAYPDETGGGFPLPGQILLFIDNIWEYAEKDPAAFREEVRITYLHELGHYLGLDEADLEARDLD